MPKNKKKWIDKKNAVTFHLVHRSQQDPLAADETAPQRVLLAAPSSQGKTKKSKEEEMKFGIYFDDDYDYLQHLRESETLVAQWEQVPEKVTQEKPPKENNIKLPSSVFASEVEEDVGLLNRAAPQSGLRLDLDPDIVAAMDEDFDFDDPDNQLDDDFILKANASGDEISEDEMEDGDSEYEDMSDDESVGGRSEAGESDDDLASLDHEETKSRFTEFSMSSSVVPRNDQLTLLDDRFEKMFAEYDENEIGALDCEEIEGELNPEDDMVLRLAEEEFDKRSKIPDPECGHVMLSDSESSSLEDERLVPLEEKERWDCESILSTYSNLYNHPKLISEPRVNKIKVNNRTGMPVVDDNRLTAKNLARLGGEEGKEGPGSVISALSTLSIRNKDETPEEKRQRKAALRQYRKDRRVEKKLNSSAFKEEKKRQERNMMNSRVNTVAVHM